MRQVLNGLQYLGFHGGEVVGIVDGGAGMGIVDGRAAVGARVREVCLARLLIQGGSGGEETMRGA